MKRINADKPHRWKADSAASVDQFNQWFVQFAPSTFRRTRSRTTSIVKGAFLATNDLRNLDAPTLKAHPEVLSTLRMCTAPPIAVDRLVGLAGASKSLVENMELGKLPPRMETQTLQDNLHRLSHVLDLLLDRDIFPWLATSAKPAPDELDRAATIVADRLCGAVANPIIRNAQERRQLALIGDWLKARGYQENAHPTSQPLTNMKPGTFSFRMNVVVGKSLAVNIPIDVVIQPKVPHTHNLPILIEAKSAGDFTNTNKRRKEEATKIQQLKSKYGARIRFILFLCGYFGSDYLGYEAAEGIDWVWEHRIDDLAQLGL